MNFKKCTVALLAILVVCFVFAGAPLAKAEQTYYSQFETNNLAANHIKTDGDSFVLQFNANRPGANHDGVLSAYQDGWWYQNSPTIDSEGNLKDFSVDIVLHIAGADTKKQTMSLKVDNNAEPWNKNKWNGTTLFDSINVTSKNIAVEYYTYDDGSLIKPHLLQYDLFLRQDGDKLVLKVPKLENVVIAHIQGDTSYKNVFLIENIKFSEEAIYLNGTAGNDAADGKTPQTAVKTFQKAKELAKNNPGAKKIIVIGTADLEGDISLSETNAEIIRGEEFKGYLFNVPAGKTASLSNVVLNGNADINKEINNSLIKVNDGATLNIGDKAVLKNNKIKNRTNNKTEGGAIYAYRATVNMTGGNIDGNQANYGGGIFLYKSTLNFSGGIIQNNNALRFYDTDVWQYYAAGGGVLAYEGSTVNFSNDAVIKNNKSGEIGGGISIGGNDGSSAPNILKMTGGVIEGNTAGAAGGGIFIQAELNKTIIHKAYIEGGKIINNAMDGSGRTEKSFGGGGIYVNGMPEEWHYQGHVYRGSNGELYLHNAVIKDNKARIAGAGFAGCPISKTKIHATNGVALYDNATTVGNEIYILSQPNYGFHGGIPEYEISKRMLGGNLYHWKKEDGSLLADDEHKGRLPSYTSLALHTEQTSNALTDKLAKVIISGNTSATRGGGIGSNGTVTFGIDEPTTKVSVSKIWEDNNNPNRPRNITVTLVATFDGEEYDIETRELNQENEWKTTFSDLPIKNIDKPIHYFVKETPVDGYAAPSISGTEENGFTITNAMNPEFVSIDVKKVWEDNANQDGKRPSSVSVQLLADGKEVAGETLTLSKENNWAGSFANLAEYKDGKKIAYTVKEVSVGNGYTSVLSGNQKVGYTITNIRTPNTPPPVKPAPKTGDSANIALYIALFVLAGIFLAGAGLKKTKKNKM